MAGHAVKHALRRAGLDPAEVDDVVMGCGLPEGATGHNIARNAALDELRRRRRLATLAAPPADEEAAVDQEVEVALRRTVVRAALAKLSGPERELVALKFHGGLSNGELARVLGVSESAVGTRLHRVMNKLREACNETA